MTKEILQYRYRQEHVIALKAIQTKTFVIKFNGFINLKLVTFGTKYKRVIYRTDSFHTVLS